MIQKGKLLREEYAIRQAFWAEDLPEGRLKQTMIVTSSKTANEFFDARDREFIPMILGGQKDRARLVLTTTMRPRYEEHRMYVDQVTAMAVERNKLDEQSAANFIDRSTIFMLMLGLLVLIIAPTVSYFITRGFTRPLQETIGEIESVAAGSNQQVTYTGTDEIGALADACRKLLSYTRGVAAAADALKSGRSQR